MADNPPSRRIDRVALERIIQRATELQAGEMDTGESMTEAELLKLGSDVGIDGRFLRQAMYEETSLAAPEERGIVARWFGPARVFASRVVTGEKAQVEDALAHWMSDGEALAVKRRLPDRTVWEQQKGFFAQMKRGFGVGGRSYHLARALDVSVAVTQLESAYCHVELVADLSQQRSGHVGGGLAVAGVGALLAPAFVAVGASVLVPPAVLVVFGVGGWMIGRAFRHRVAQMQLALEQVLDRLEHGEIKPRHLEAAPSPLFKFADEIRRAITDGVEAGRHQRRLPPRP